MDLTIPPYYSIFSHLLTIDVVNIVFIPFKKWIPKEHFRQALLVFFNQKKTMAENHRILIETYGNVAPSIKTCEYWFRQFKNGDFNVNDKDCSGQLKNTRADLQILLDKNSAQSTSQFAREMLIVQYN